MREFESLRVEEPRPYGAYEIKRLHLRERASQAVFAAYLNTSVSTVQKWEIGEKKPSGPALKLLDLVERGKPLGKRRSSALRVVQAPEPVTTGLTPISSNRVLSVVVQRGHPQGD